MTYLTRINCWLSTIRFILRLRCADRLRSCREVIHTGHWWANASFSVVYISIINKDYCSHLFLFFFSVLRFVFFRVANPVVCNFNRRGKKYYYAPEYFVSLYPALHCYKIDMWSMGIVLLLLTTGAEPYNTRQAWSVNMQAFFQFVQAGRLGSFMVLNPQSTGQQDEVIELSSRLHLNALTALNSMLVVDPDFRNASIEDILSLPWLQS